MCHPISLVMSADRAWGPSPTEWNHSHTDIFKRMGVDSGLQQDRYARVEVHPPDDRFFGKDGKLLAVDDSWDVILDENREPAWWSEDRPAQIERARREAQKWLDSCEAKNLIPGAVVVAGNYGTATAGEEGILCIRWRDARRYRLAVAYVGENGIKPDTKYRVDDQGKFIEA